MEGQFSGSGGIKSSSILNHDNTQMITPTNWGIPLSGSEISVGLFNLSGSNGGASGSTGDNSVCFGSVPFPSHTSHAGNPGLFMLMYPQLSDHSTVSGSVQGTQFYPTGSNQTSSLKVYSPKCDQMYMARLYQFTASKGVGGTYTITDIEDAKDVTGELTGSKNGFKLFNKHFIKLRNDVI